MAVDELSNLQGLLQPLSGSDVIAVEQLGYRVQTTVAALYAAMVQVNLQAVSAILGAGPYNDLGASTIPAFVSGKTNRMLLTAAVGDTTINGIDASGMTDGQSFLIKNQSATDSLLFSNLGGGLAANQFENGNSTTWAIPPKGAARVNRIGTKFTFS